MLRCMILTEPEQTLRTRPLHRREYQSLAELGPFDDEDVELLGGGLKAVLYAAAGIGDYWVVDLTRDELVVHREPAGTTFASITRHRDGPVTALHHPGVVIDPRHLLR